MSEPICHLICMTNRARLRLYQTIGQEFARDNGLMVQETHLVDTSWIEDLEVGQQRLLEVVAQIKAAPPVPTVIIIKDAKWPLTTAQLQKHLPQNQIWCAHVPLSVVETYASTGDVQGLTTYIHNLLAAKYMFVRVASRLGLLHPPKGETSPNIGVEYGPTAVLSDTFAQKYTPINIIDYTFTSPDQVTPSDYYSILAQEYQPLISQISHSLSLQTPLITAGGDHSVALASVASVLRVFDPATTGLIMIDSHADLHQPSTSPSGNFHGMWLRPVVDTFEKPVIDKLIPHKLPVKNLMYIGNLDLEPAETDFIADHKILTFSKPHLSKPNFTKTLEQFIQTKKHIHVSIDIDAFSHNHAPATGMMIKNGLSPQDVFLLLDLIKKHPSISVDLVEVNPTLSGSAQTIHLAQELLMKLVPENEV